MDKYELVLDIVEHPEKYTSRQLAEIMSDAETREIYCLLSKAESAMKFDKEIDVDAEWECFSEKHSVCRDRPLFKSGNRAASIAAIAGTSIIAVAAGIAVSVAVTGRKPEQAADSKTAAPSAATVSTETITARSDSAEVVRIPVMFEDEPLEKIMKELAVAYGVEIKFNNPETAKLHLYYKLDTSLPINEVVEQLNTFEQIDIKQKGNILTID